MPQPITLTREQSDALAALPPWADRRARIAVLGWKGRPLTPAEWNVIEPPEAEGPSRVEILHRKDKQLAKLWAAVEQGQARLDDTTAAWAAAVAAVRRAQLQSNAPEPDRPARVNIAEWMTGRRQPPEMSTLLHAEKDALATRARAADDWVQAREAYHRALTLAAVAHGIL